MAEQVSILKPEYFEVIHVKLNGRNRLEFVEKGSRDDLLSFTGSSCLELVPKWDHY